MNDNKNQPISVVILAHNEVEIIEKVVMEFYDKIIRKNKNSELIIAEDGSTDGTKEILKRLIKGLTQLRWVEEKEKQGYVNAFKKALSLPKNELILFCDCSGKHDPNDVWGMLDIIDKNDMIIGYKIKRKDPMYRIAIAKVFNFLVRIYFNVPFIDIDCPLRLIKKKSLMKVFKNKFIQKELINFELTLRFHFLGLKVSQLPVKHFKRQNGPSRGLPLQKIPGVIFEVLKNFPKLKKEFHN